MDRAASYNALLRYHKVSGHFAMRATDTNGRTRGTLGGTGTDAVPYYLPVQSVGLRFRPER